MVEDKLQTLLSVCLALEHKPINPNNCVGKAEKCQFTDENNSLKTLPFFSFFFKMISLNRKFPSLEIQIKFLKIYKRR